MDSAVFRTELSHKDKDSVLVVVLASYLIEAICDLVAFFFWANKGLAESKEASAAICISTT